MSQRGQKPNLSGAEDDRPLTPWKMTERRGKLLQAPNKTWTPPHNGMRVLGANVMDAAILPPPSRECQASITYGAIPELYQWPR